MSGLVWLASTPSVRPAYGLNSHVSAAAPRSALSRFVPVIITTSPATPQVGVNEVMVGAHAPAPAVDE